MDIRHPLIAGTTTSGKTSLHLILQAEAAARAAGPATRGAEPAAPAVPELPAVGRDDRYADATAMLTAAQAIVGLRHAALPAAPIRPQLPPGRPPVVLVVDEAAPLLTSDVLDRPEVARLLRELVGIGRVSVIRTES
ncbi:hypothetical protein [Kitasatospora sp. HPMI-4]|uniref:hypothetical protein n=1 Tax=Kitasatospora sp. HPMI-4 TaxID=3448443 RepID=UPI003F1B0DEA